MSSLMEMGLLLQPHTSAGRIPTIDGLRYYVENILEVNELDEAEQDMMRNHYQMLSDEELSLPSVLKRTSKFLSIILLIATEP